MNKALLLISTIIISNTASAQNVSLKDNIIYSGHTPYAQLKIWTAKPVNYSVNSLDGKELLTIHHSRLYVKGKPGYCITFLNDNKKAFMVSSARLPQAMMKEMVICNLITNGSVNDSSEIAYIKKHPLPEGYIDVNDVNDFYHFTDDIMDER